MPAARMPPARSERLIKAVEVAAGLALPADVSMKSPRKASSVVRDHDKWRTDGCRHEGAAS